MKKTILLLLAVGIIAAFMNLKKESTSVSVSYIELTVQKTGEKISVSNERLLSNLAAFGVGDTVNILRNVCPTAQTGYIEWVIPVQTEHTGLGENTQSGVTGECYPVRFKAIVTKKM